MNTTLTVRSRRISRLHTIEEMLTLSTQRLISGKRYDFGDEAAGGDAYDPAAT